MRTTTIIQNRKGFIKSDVPRGFHLENRTANNNLFFL